MASRDELLQPLSAAHGGPGATYRRLSESSRVQHRVLLAVIPNYLMLEAAVVVDTRVTLN